MNNPPNIPVICIALANERSETGFLRGLTIELREILNALEPAVQQGKVELKLMPAATSVEVANAFQDPWLEGRIKVFHYAGHADEDELWLETDAGGNQGFTSLGLARFLGAQDSLNLVFLNGCATQLHADLLIKAKIPVAMVTATKINDQQATTFAGRFYKGLASGANVESAFTEAEAFLLGVTKNVKEDINRGLFWKKSQESEEEQFPWRMFSQETKVEEKPAKEWKLFKGPAPMNEDLSLLSPVELMARKLIGESVGGYKIVMLLGMGSTSIVFKGVHEIFHDEVAIKAIHSIEEGFSRASRVLIDGVRSLRELKHPNVVRMIWGGPMTGEGLDFWEKELLFIVREIVKGDRMDQVEFGLPQLDASGIDQLVGYAIQLAKGLKAAHNHRYIDADGTEQVGVVHGNLRPSKIMFTPTGVPRINDFLFADLAKVRGVRFKTSGKQEESAPDFLTEDYLPPEVVSEEEAVSMKSDVYSLGAVLLFMFSGKKKLSELQPLSREHIAEVLKKQSPLIPVGLAIVLAKALAPVPKDRYQRVDDLLIDLEMCISTSPKEVSVVDIVMAEAREDSSGIVDSLTGKVLSNYLIKDFLGEGFQGFVFKGVHQSSGEEVAIKITHRVAKGFAKAQKILEKNARAFKYLNHPNIAGPLAVGTLGNEEYLYVIRELVNGVRLDKLIQWSDEPEKEEAPKSQSPKRKQTALERHTLRVPELSIFGLQRLNKYSLEICEGLNAAHALEYIDLDGEITYGIMHGNLKARKIMITDQGPKIIDFMFGEIFNDPEIIIATPRDIREAYLESDRPADYQPPEVVAGLQKPSKRTDVYALGAVFFEIFAGTNLTEFKLQSVDQLHKFLLQRNPHIPELTARIFFKALHPESYLRYNTVNELIKDIMKSTPAMFQVYYGLSSGIKRIFR